MDNTLEKTTGALAAIGLDDSIRSHIISLCLKAERRLAQQDFNVRDEITGPIVDALHQNIDSLKKRLCSGIDFHFYYRSKIARDFVMSQTKEPDHVWEPQTTKLLLHFGQRARQVIIGGAYSGDQAILLSHQMMKTGGLCHCFEPNKDQMSMLKFNSQVNGIDNIIFNQIGLWEDDDVELVLVGEDSFAHPEIAQSTNDPNAFTTISINSYGKQRSINKIDIIMLDVEGAELSVLKGADDFLSQPSDEAPCLIFEIHRNYVNWSSGLNNTGIVQFVQSHGYSVFSIRDYQSNVPMTGQKIELIRPEDTYLEGPPHGFNMLAVKNIEMLDHKMFHFCKNVSPKLLFHRDPILHQPQGTTTSK
jgi:FkbM family methyltransferase